MRSTYRRHSAYNVLRCPLSPPIRDMISDSGIELFDSDKRTWGRIESSVSQLLGAMPKYGQKPYRRLCKIVTMAWGEQSEHGYDAITMLYTALWLVEDVIISLRLAAIRNEREEPEEYPLWLELAGSMFAFSKALGDEWIDPSDSHQVQADQLGRAVMQFA